MGRQPSWRDWPDQQQSSHPASTASEIKTVTPPIEEDKSAREKSQREESADGKSARVKSTPAGTLPGGKSSDVFDLSKMTAKEVAAELVRRSQPSRRNTLDPRDEESRHERPRDNESRHERPRDNESRHERPRDNESRHERLSDAEVAAFFAPLPTFLQERSEHDHSSPAYDALRQRLSAEAMAEETQERDPLDVLSRALQTRIAERKKATLVSPTPSAATTTTGTPAKINIVAEIGAAAKAESNAENSAFGRLNLAAEAAAMVAPVDAPLIEQQRSLAMPPMPSEVVADAIALAPAAADPALPQAFETTALDVTAPQALDMTVPQAPDVTAPEALDATVPQALDATVPQALDATAPQAPDPIALESLAVKTVPTVGWADKSVADLADLAALARGDNGPKNNWDQEAGADTALVDRGQHKTRTVALKTETATPSRAAWWRSTPASGDTKHDALMDDQGRGDDKFIGLVAPSVAPPSLTPTSINPPSINPPGLTSPQPGETDLASDDKPVMKSFSLDKLRGATAGTQAQAIRFIKAGARSAAAKSAALPTLSRATLLRSRALLASAGTTWTGGSAPAFRWDILVAGVVLGALVMAVPVVYLWRHEMAVQPAAVTNPDVAGSSSAITPLPVPVTTTAATPMPAPASVPTTEFILPPAPPVPMLATAPQSSVSPSSVSPSSVSPSSTTQPSTTQALTQEQADKLLQSAQSLSTQAGSSVTSSTTAAAPTTTTKPAATTPATTTKAATTAKTTVKKAKKPATRTKPATTDQLSPAKR